MMRARELQQPPVQLPEFRDRLLVFRAPEAGQRIVL